MYWKEELKFIKEAMLYSIIAFAQAEPELQGQKFVRGNRERKNNINSKTIYQKHVKLALLLWIYPVNVSQRRPMASVRIAMGKQQTLIYFRWSKCPA